MTKGILCTFYIIIVAALASATLLEHSAGTVHAHTWIYGSWWFTLSWALLVIFSACWIFKRRIKEPSTLLLHLSFMVILTGAAITHFTSSKGLLHVRKGETKDSFLVTSITGTGMSHAKLPFSIKLKDFHVEYYKGTSSPADYVSDIVVYNGNEQETATVSMNNIYVRKGYRLCQNSFDDDMNGTTLSVNSDPWGIPVSYCGYALLVISMSLMLMRKNGPYRKVLRMAQKAFGNARVITILLAGGCFTSSIAQTTIPADVAKDMGSLHISHNGRVCTVETFATDFVRKIHGRSSYNGLSAVQVMAGFIFWGDEWCMEPILRIKGGDVRDRFDIDGYCPVNFFINPDVGGYILGPYLVEHYNGNHDSFHKQVFDIDSKLQIVFELRKGTSLLMFPHVADHNTLWLSPTEKMPGGISSIDSIFISDAFSLLYQCCKEKDFRKFKAITEDIRSYQTRNGGVTLPSKDVDMAEHILNTIPFTTILFMANLTLGLLSVIMLILKITAKASYTIRLCMRAIPYAMCASCLLLTAGLVTRWIACGYVPMANGYETMLFTAWIIQVLSLLTYRHFPIMITFGFILSGLFLLVSHINQMDPQIGQLMPVLNSPLLSIHVSIIMIAYALLSLSFICSLTAIAIYIIMYRKKKEHSHGTVMIHSLRILSLVLLYPSLAFLGTGIFIGAVWANVSWGEYWSWDPKETWALITFMTYGVAVHNKSLPFLARPMKYHVYMTMAFFTLLMTYFGVNYLLGGMHSYA